MWLVQRITTEHDTSAFDSGQTALENWLRREAVRADRQDVERVCVWTAEDDPVVVAFFATRASQVATTSISRGLAGGHTSVPCYLITRLALHCDLQGRGEGSQLLLSALDMCVRVADFGAARLIVVDAIDEAAHNFYMHYGFVATKTPARLVMKVATARRGLGLE